MTPRGNTLKGEARREALIGTTMRLVSRNGSRGTSLAQIAEESGVSQAGLLYYFPTKEALLQAALDRRDSVENGLLWRGDEMGLSVFDSIAHAVHDWSVRPEAVGMHTVLVAENVGQDGPLRPRLRKGYEDTVAHLTTILRRAQIRGEARPDFDPELKAVEIVAFINGLETAWLLNPTMRAAQVATQWAASQKRELAN